MTRFIRKWPVVSCIILYAVFLNFEFSHAQESMIDVSGRIEFKTIVSEFRSSSFVPSPPDEKNVDHQFVSAAVLNARYDQTPFRFVANGRLMLGRGNEASNTRASDEIGNLDELFAEYTPIHSVVFFGGRRNMSFGHSLAINPSDVFKVRRHHSRNRAESKGTDKIGVEYFSESGNAIRAIWAPSTNFLNDGIPDRIYSSFETQVGESYTDVLLCALYGDTPSGGGAVAATTEGGIVFYGVVTVRHGGTLPQVRLNEGTKTYSVLESDGEK